MYALHTRNLLSVTGSKALLMLPILQRAWSVLCHNYACTECGITPQGPVCALLTRSATLTTGASTCVCCAAAPMTLHSSPRADHSNSCCCCLAKGMCSIRSPNQTCLQVVFCAFTACSCCCSFLRRSLATAGSVCACLGCTGPSRPSSSASSSSAPAS